MSPQENLRLHLQEKNILALACLELNLAIQYWLKCVLLVYESLQSLLGVSFSIYYILWELSLLSLELQTNQEGYVYLSFQHLCFKWELNERSYKHLDR